MKRKKFELVYEEEFLIHADVDAFFNATEMAAPFGKRPIDFLRLPETERYIDALCKKYKVRKSHFIKTSRGKGVGGTWFHKKLVVIYARWLDPDFAVWCDEQVELILFEGKHWKVVRQGAADGYKYATASMVRACERMGIEVRPFFYTHVANHINKAFCGKPKFEGRGKLTSEQLKALKSIEMECTIQYQQIQSNDYHSEYERIDHELEQFVAKKPDLLKIRQEMALRLTEEKIAEDAKLLEDKDHGNQ